MNRIKKIPDEIAKVLTDLNECGTKRKLSKKYGCSNVAIDNYEKRKGYKFIKSSLWSLKKIENTD
jgi:hypothetical protein